MCKASESCKLQERVEAIEECVSKIKDNMSGWRADITKAINDLGHDVGVRMNTMSTKLIDEKVAWGSWARTNLSKVVLWACGLIAFACGMNKMPEIINAIKEFNAS